MSRHSQHPSFPVTSSAETESGYGTQYVPRAIPPNEHIRQPVPVVADTIDSNPMKFVALALVHLQRQFKRVAVAIEDRSQAVDEYQSQTLVGPVTNTLTLQPQYETNERITSIIVVGPAGTATVVLGDRVFPLTIPASGILVIAPVSLFIGRDDIRQLTTATPGQINLILGGYADTRGVAP